MKKLKPHCHVVQLLGYCTFEGTILVQFGVTSCNRKYCDAASPHFPGNNWKIESREVINRSLKNEENLIVF